MTPHPTDLSALLTLVGRQTSALVLFPDHVHMSKVWLLFSRNPTQMKNSEIYKDLTKNDNSVYVNILQV